MTATPSVRAVPTITTAVPRVVSQRRCAALTTGVSARPSNTPTPMPVSTSPALSLMANIASATAAARTSATNDHGSMSTSTRPSDGSRRSRAPLGGPEPCSAVTSSATPVRYASVQPGQRPTEHRVVRITARSAVVGVLVLVAAVVAQRVFVAAHRPLSWAAAAVVVAVLIDPIVDLLDRHIPRLAAVIVALVVVGGAAFAVVYLAFHDLADGLDRLGRAAEDAAAQLEERDDSVGDLARDVDAARRVELFVDTLDERVTGGNDVLVSTAGTAPTYLVGGILTLFLMSYGPRFAQSAV